MTIKGYVLDALQKFWNKLKTTYVTDCTTDDDNLALAASQGKVLGDRVNDLEGKTNALSQISNHLTVSSSHVDILHGYLFCGTSGTEGEARVNLATSGRACRLAVTSGTRKVGIWDSTREVTGATDVTDNWILVSDVSGVVTVPHELRTMGPSTTNVRSVIVSENKESSNGTVSVIATTSSTLIIQAKWGTTAFSNRSIAIPHSDRRLKENIEPNTKSGLGLINALNVKQFDWKDGHGHWDYGIIAQEARELDPNLVVGEEKEDTYLSIDTLYLADALVKAVQELTVEVEKLKVEVEYLKTNK